VSQLLYDPDDVSAQRSSDIDGAKERQQGSAPMEVT
jgi:hypothetical protein